MFYEIHAVHHGDDEPTIETRVRYISAYEGSCSDGWVLSVDRVTHTGTLMSNDDLLNEPCAISPDQPYGNIALTLDPGELLWLKACWMNILKTDLASIERLFEDASVRLVRRANSASSELN